MKNVLHLGFGLLVVVLIPFAFIPPKAEVYEQAAPEVIEKTVIEEVPQLDNRIIDAIQASSTAIEEEAKKAYEEKKHQLEKEIELSVTRQYREEIEARELALEKEVSL